MSFPHHFTKEQVLDMNEKYNSGMTLAEVGYVYNCSASNIRHHLLQSGFKTRPSGYHSKRENNINWKGGRINVRGYVGILNPNHPRADIHGYVLEHILVWESFYNKKLKKGLVIHHLNGIKNDNRIENLVAMKRGEHIHQIEPYVKRIIELEDKIEILSNPMFFSTALRGEKIN